MNRRPVSRFVFVAGLAAGFAALALQPAGAQVRFAHPDAPIDFVSPYDESYGTSPSFQIQPTPYGTAVRVVERCQYPNGWNVTDFTRDLNGTPAGIDHTCPVAGYDRRLRSRY